MKRPQPFRAVAAALTSRRACVTVVSLFAAALLSGCVVFRPAAGRVETAVFEHIRFDDLAAQHPTDITWCWNAVGKAPDDSIYIVFGGPRDDITDCLLFRYRPDTGQRDLLGSLVDAARAAGNWRSGERIEKGHTHLPYHDGRMYIGTMGFHNAIGGQAQSLNVRGAHLMAYDIAAGRIEDLAAAQPDGVFAANRGFMAIATVPARGLVVGFTVPGGDLVVWDAATGQVRARTNGPPEESLNPVGREVVAAPNGRIYTSFTPLPKDRREEPGRLYVYDLETLRLLAGPLETDPSLWNGQTRTRDGTRIYLATMDGTLYRLDYEHDRLVRLGSLIPEGARGLETTADVVLQPATVLGITLSRDETKVYCVPIRRRVPKGAVPGPRARRPGYRVLYGLCEFDLDTGTCRKVMDFPEGENRGWVTGSDVRDADGNIYFARHGGGFCGLLKIHVGRRGECVAGHLPTNRQGVVPAPTAE